MILTVKTDARTQFKEITEMVRRAISESGVSHGICMLFVPHTTAAITINENADPNVQEDVLMVLNEIIPWESAYRHGEGNSPAHIKSILTGASELLEIRDGQPVLGTWQGIFFCEFDGPRSRTVHLKIV